MTSFAKKRLFVSLDGSEHPVEVEPSAEPDAFAIRVSREGAGPARTVRVLRGLPAPLVLVDGRVLALGIFAESGELRVSRGPDTRRARVGNESETLEAGRQASAAGLLAAPMPGRVVAVHVQAGDALEKGALLVVIEAMKMQNELFSSGPGRVEQVLVKAGDTVERGAPLLRVV